MCVVHIQERKAFVSTMVFNQFSICQSDECHVINCAAVYGNRRIWIFMINKADTMRRIGITTQMIGVVAIEMMPRCFLRVPLLPRLAVAVMPSINLPRPLISMRKQWYPRRWISSPNEPSSRVLPRRKRTAALDTAPSESHGMSATVKYRELRKRMEQSLQESNVTSSDSTEDREWGRFGKLLWIILFVA